MSTNLDSGEGAPPANRTLQAVAVVLLAIPLLALIPVGWYSRKTPELGGFPFFIWYQMLWVFLCAGFTYAAYVLVERARPHRPLARAATQPTGRGTTNGADTAIQGDDK